ncbi:hypothetical protein [Rhizobium sp. Leaf262]|uniref:hypothetical protein n=1 Tax=Rhizobium sp. Leaf262 TaxID=1736312 RepID=UPI000716326C|nr:hypothetical protein [Rhizobium sp. Leaf262]KQO75293.1 hypothetical protein ASF29_12835 [Rhizobium sp. Leaf262]
MREHIRQILVSVTALLPTSETPATPLAVTYGGNRVYWSPQELVLVMPDIAGGSGQYVYALASATPLPADLSFDSATGAMTTAVARIIVVK